MGHFITLTQPDGRKIALNTAHIIAISPTEPHEFNPVPASRSSIHTTIGAEQQGWHEWNVVEDFDDILRRLAQIDMLIEEQEDDGLFDRLVSYVRFVSGCKLRPDSLPERSITRIWRHDAEVLVARPDFPAAPRDGDPA